MKRINKLSAILIVLSIAVFIVDTTSVSPTDTAMRAIAEAPLSESVTQAVDDESPTPNIVAKSAIVINADTRQVLYEKSADAERAPASTTKLMTLLLACEKGDMDKTITVPQSASTVPADSTRVPVYPGQKMSYKDLVYSMMIKSGNDAANAIATLTSGSVSAFVSDMNARAEQMGLSGTHFVNAHGYPAQGHYSTSRDMAKLMAAVLNNKKALDVIKARTYKMASGTVLTNGYAILDPDSSYYYKYAIGGKTGYSTSSGQCFVCAAKKDGKTLISVVLYSGLKKGDKWSDTKAILEYGFAK